MEKLIREADILVENFILGPLITWASPGSIFKKSIPSDFWFDQRVWWVFALCECKAYENVAQAAGGAASTTGFWEVRRW